MKLPDESGGIAGFTQNIPDVHVVALQCDIEIGQPLILLAADRFGVKFAMRVAGKPTGQEAVSGRSTNRTADVGTRELHSLFCHAVKIRSVGLTPKRGDA